MKAKLLKWYLAIAVCISVALVWILRNVFAPTPRAAFEYLVAQPVPASVAHIEEGGFRTMDSVFRVLRFDISSPDMQNILSSQGYKPTEGNWDYWEKRIQQVTKLQVHFGEDWHAYTLQEGHGQKFIFSNTNTSRAVFVADAH